MASRAKFAEVLRRSPRMTSRILRAFGLVAFPLFVRVAVPGEWRRQVIAGFAFLAEWAAQSGLLLSALVGCAIFVAIVAPDLVSAIRRPASPTLGVALVVAASILAGLTAWPVIVPALTAGLAGFILLVYPALRRPRREHGVVQLDAPIRATEQDQFSRGDLAHRLVVQLTMVNARCPTVAVVAGIGEGKTSLANLAAELL